jgi:SAM-dependent methyltransferase
MNRQPRDMSTDAAWEEWGRRDPYFGVITDPKFRSGEMSEQAEIEFFESGRSHVNYVMQTIHKYVDANFEPKRVLDFGCGVGRLLIPFASVGKQVFGLDVSPSMLHEAKRNCEVRGVTNVHFLQSDDTLSSLSGGFDLIHSFIVFQHIPVERGIAIYSKLLQHLRPGGIGALHFTYSKARYSTTNGIAPIESRSVAPTSDPGSPNTDPEIQMNPYNLNSILFMIQKNNVAQLYADFTDHGGELGVFLFFTKAR